MAVKRPVFVVALALILGELLAFLGAHIVIFLLCVPIVLVQKIIMKKCSPFLMMIFLFCIVGFCVTKEEIKISDYTYSLQSRQVTVYGTYRDCDKTGYGYKYELDNVTMGKVSYRKILVYTAKAPKLRPGNRVKVSGELKQFDIATNYGNFDARNYYRSLGIYVSIEEKKMQVINNDYCSFKNKMQILRIDIKNILKIICNDENTGLYRLCDEEKAGIFSAVLLGDKSDLDEEIQSLYQINGIAHVLAISGLHISAIGVVVYKLLRKRFKYILSGSIALIVVLGFVFMAGEGISAVRAAGMFIFYLLSQMIGRKYDMLSAMSFVTIIACLSNPFIVYNIAFQMSFGAILGILFINPLINDFIGISSANVIDIKEIRKKKYMKERVRLAIKKVIISCGKSMFLSFSINLILFPILAGSFFQISLYSIILNVVVVPFMVVVLGSAILAVGLQGIVLVFGMGVESMLAKGILIVSKTVVCLGCIILEWYEMLCKLFSKIPGNIYVTGKPSVEQVIVYYVLLFIVLCIIGVREGKKKKIKEYYDETLPYEGRKVLMITKAMCIRKIYKACVRVVCIFIFAGVLIFIISSQYTKGLEVIFNDVGQGDCIILKNKSFVFMVDGGSTDIADLNRRRLEPLLKARGIIEIDMVVVTHTDMDHISGIMSMLESDKADKIKIKVLALPYTMIKDENYNRLVYAAKESNTELMLIKQGDVISNNELRITCLHPPYEYRAFEKNAYSTVLDIKYGKLSMLLTGDITENEEKLLLEHIDTCYTVLKVPHHGSKYSSSNIFLQRIRPKISIISCGEDNSYGHPHEEVRQRLKAVDSSILRTDILGQIVVKTDGKVMKIYHVK